MEPNEGYSLTHAKSAIEDADWVSGDHRMDGVIVAAGPAVTPFTSTPYLIDMAPTMLAALGAPAASSPGLGALERRWLRGLGEVRGRSRHRGDRRRGQAVSDTEADEMEEHLRGLGYLE